MTAAFLLDIRAMCQHQLACSYVNYRLYPVT